MTTTEKIQKIYEQEVKEILGEEPITLEGFLLNVSMPSEARLQQRLSKHQIEGLTELIQTASVRDISFSFFDNSFSNTIKGIRRDLYTKVIQEFCIKIQQIENKALYLLPAKNLERFVEEIEELNNKLATLKREIELAQTRLKENEGLQKILKKYNLKIKQVNTAGFKIYYQFDPVKIDNSSIREFVSETIIKKYMSQLEDRNRQVITSLEQELLSSLRTLLTKLGRKLSGEKIHYKSLDFSLQILENKTDSVGLDHLSNLTHTVRTFLTQINEKEESSLEACAHEISDLVRITESENPKTTIALGLNKLNGVVDSRILSLQKKMMESEKV